MALHHVRGFGAWPMRASITLTPEALVEVLAKHYAEQGIVVISGMIHLESTMRCAFVSLRSVVLDVDMPTPPVKVPKKAKARR